MADRTVQLLAVVTANDGADVRAGFKLADFTKQLHIAQGVWAAFGIRLIFEPSRDVQYVASSLLNNDYPVDKGGKPLTLPPDPQLENNPNDRARYDFALRKPGKLVLFVRDGQAKTATNFSNGWTLYLVITPATEGYTVAHELGHYFGLSHPFYENPYPLNMTMLAETIRKAFPNPPSEASVLNLYDADRRSVNDTPADPGPTVFEAHYGWKAGDCGPQDSITVEVDYPSGSKSYTFRPDRFNLMGYFGCRPRTLSPQQRGLVVGNLDSGNRRHLLDARSPVVGPVLNVFYRALDGRVVKLWGGKHWPLWQSNVLTDVAQAPTAAGDPSCYLIGDTQHVVYRRADGHTQELFQRPAWATNTISALAKAPAPAGDPAGCVTSGESQHVVYRGTDGHIHELFTNPDWVFNNLTALAGAPRAAGDPACCVSPDGKLHVIYRGTDNQIHELFTNPKWVFNTLTILAKAPQVAGDPACCVSGDGKLHVIYRGTDNQIYELFTNPKWVFNSLTVLAEAPQAAGDPACCVSGDGKLHVIYRGTDAQIHELFTNPAWVFNTLSAQAGGPKAVRDPTCLIADGRMHVFYQSEKAMWEIAIKASKWARTDLRAPAGPLAPGGKPAALVSGGA